jgi:SRSO17 transposase
MGVYLAHVGPHGRAMVDKRLYLPEKWLQDPERCEAAGVPREAIEAGYQSKSELALGLLRRAQEIGALRAGWVLADDDYGKSPVFRDDVAGLGLRYMLEVPCNTLVWTKPTAEDPTARWEMRQRAVALPAERWQAITVAPGEQGPRTYQFAFERLWDNREHGPAKCVWAVYRKNLDGSEPRYYFSNAPAQTRHVVLAKKAAARWPIETEIETNKSDVGLDEYEVRTWQGWNHPMTLCLLASAFLLTLQQDWGEKAVPDHAATGLPAGARDVAARALLASRPRAVA